MVPRRSRASPSRTSLEDRDSLWCLARVYQSGVVSDHNGNQVRRRKVSLGVLEHIGIGFPFRRLVARESTGAFDFVDNVKGEPHQVGLQLSGAEFGQYPRSDSIAARAPVFCFKKGITLGKRRFVSLEQGSVFRSNK